MNMAPGTCKAFTSPVYLSNGRCQVDITRKGIATFWSHPSPRRKDKGSMATLMEDREAASTSKMAKAASFSYQVRLM
jgi:hypothetical protein